MFIYINKSVCYTWNHLFDDIMFRVMITEGYTSVKNTMKYYGSEDKLGAHLPFNFGLISYLNDQSKATDFCDTVHDWLDNMPYGKWANWVVNFSFA